MRSRWPGEGATDEVEVAGRELRMTSLAEGHHGLPRLLVGLDPRGGAVTLAEHERIHGPLPRRSALELIEAVELSGLRGRGGADFPTARKLRAVAGDAVRGRPRRSGRPSAVIVNGSETEPASGKDELLLSRLPHLVLDGAVLCAEALGAPEVIVKVGESEREPLRSLEHAVRERVEDPVPILLRGSPDGYVTGEESAVVHFLNGGAPIPTFVPPRPFERGYCGRPTLIQNPETLAQVALVARFGPHWYRELGTTADPGSALVTISGAVAAPGVYELAFGTPMLDLLEAAGGSTEPLQALLIGGYFGTWVDSSRAFRARLAREELRSIGASLGSGVLIALGEGSCGLHESARVIDYLAAASSGQCGPCLYGLDAVARAVSAMASGTAPPKERERLLRWTSEIRGRGACHHPDGAVRFVESVVEVFGHEIERHRRGRCQATPARLPLGPVAHGVAVAGGRR